MQRKHILLRTNIVVCLIIAAGFLLTAVLSYQANYSAALQNLEHVSLLASEGIYYQLASAFSKPVNVSLTMANDSLLKEHLYAEPQHLADESYVQTLQQYLAAYREKYQYDSVFLVSTATQRYYNFNGIDRVLTSDNPENDWYYALMDTEVEHSLNVDNDEAANDEITVFVNCKIKDAAGRVIGIVGVGARIDSLQALILDYQQQFGVSAFLIDERGDIQIAAGYSGYHKQNFFTLYGLESVRDEVIGWKEDTQAKTMWNQSESGRVNESYLVTRYLPELSWHLVVERDTGLLANQFRWQLYRTMAVIFAIIISILIIITCVIRRYNRQILKLTEAHRETFRMVTEQLYDNIYELNITKNCAAGLSTQRYFESLGVPSRTPYDQALQMIAQTHVKEEFRAGYIATLSPENVLRQYALGNVNLQYDFMITENGSDYFWMRIDASIYRNAEDQCVHMYTYRKNIDAEKQQELQIAQMAQRDEMTLFYNKASTRSAIEQLLEKSTGELYAFFILDIDNFKQANDQCGHAFGDFVITVFAETMRRHFRPNDILGRVGGDEFAVFIPVPDLDWVTEKARTLSRALDQTCTQYTLQWNMSASIGVAVAPRDGTDFETLYKNADDALYRTKANGKNGFTLYSGG